MAKVTLLGVNFTAGRFLRRLTAKSLTWAMVRHVADKEPDRIRNASNTETAKKIIDIHNDTPIRLIQEQYDCR